MYSTCMKNDRYLVKCLTVSSYITSNHFIVDTGARLTCCKYSFIDKNIREADVADCETRLVGGLVRGSMVKFYKYPLKQFTIGNIDMGRRDIWLTFDARITDIILGMDILKQVIMIMNPYNQRVHFCKDEEDYRKNFVMAAA